jgi:hypothetical protein
MSFYEVEHEGDLEPILDDIAKAGGKVLSHNINDEAETATVEVEAPDRKAFSEKFRKTDSADWIN